MTGDSVEHTVAAGGTVALGVGAVTLQKSLPEEFELEILDAEDAVTVLEREAAPGVGDVVLLKASRGIGLDRAVYLLRGHAS